MPKLEFQKFCSGIIHYYHGDQEEIDFVPSMLHSNDHCDPGPDMLPPTN